ncbi:Anaphase-promoting complex subunit 1 [Elasticomyces elasticus]|nr:Anaphase-promoting complex subunit 1 [Elasticomyces elasticus]KAK3630011.1 Anaphase-promoting complex subunit 1 [Elasticomyces elasticus]KAK4908905.1 Anaphase-promoting complex subunit 1 [Elasticomyces elasticus]KAK5748772.1 Anaphase-promoting complex subunit 1 [Elasticomyces elasticus]
MAHSLSLGIHTPIALPHLIAEGLLPPSPKPELYQWSTYVSDDDVEEELLVTRTCVVWSQGNSVRNVYRFELEGEDVVQAVLTRFPVGDTQRQDGLVGKEGRGGVGAGKRQLGHRQQTTAARTPSEGSARALVILLKTKAHIHYLTGSKYIVPLPFEIEKAFPAPRGVILQRKPPTPPAIAVPPTPQLPAAPPNSFFFSQSQTQQPSASFLQSPNLAKSFQRSQPVKPSPLGGGGGGVTLDARLDALFQDTLGPSTTAQQQAGEEVESLYSLTSPLSDLGLITYSLQHQKPRQPHRSQGTAVESESLDPAERVVYVSSENDLQHSSPPDSEHGELMLIITLNNDTQTLTLWHAWYIPPTPLSELLAQRAAQKAAKAKRRSSFMSAVNIGTGTTTPGVRTRDHGRESFAAAGSLRGVGVGGEGLKVGKQRAAKEGRRSEVAVASRQEEEEGMKESMDPDFVPAVTAQSLQQQGVGGVGGGNRRVSSMNADKHANRDLVGASFATGGARRNTSFGGPNERKSFGGGTHRKSRGSTPGSSIFGRSLGVDNDDSMDVDSQAGEESVDDIVKHMRNTYETAGAENVFGAVDDGFKRELVVRKLWSGTVGKWAGVGVGVLRDRVGMAGGDEGVGFWVCDRGTKAVTRVKLVVRQRELYPGLVGAGRRVAVPIVVEEKAFGKAVDLIKIRHGKVEAIMLAARGIIFSNKSREECPLPVVGQYRVYSPYDLQPFNNIDIGESVGRNRTLQIPQTGLLLAQPGIRATFDEVDGEGLHHRRRLQIRPEDPGIGHLLEVCQSVLPEGSVEVRGLWCAALAKLEAGGGKGGDTGCGIEWVAFAATVLFYGVGLMDGKARAAVKLTEMSVGRGAHVLRMERHGRRVLGREALRWLDGSQLDRRKDLMMPLAAGLAVELAQTVAVALPTGEAVAVRLMLALHVAREEGKLSTLSAGKFSVGPIIAQIGHWIGQDAWGFAMGSYYDLEGAGEELWAYVKSAPARAVQVQVMDAPIGVYQWFEHAIVHCSTENYPTLSVIAGLDAGVAPSAAFNRTANALTPRICALNGLLAATAGLTVGAVPTVELMAVHGLDNDMLETLPQAIAAPFMDAMSHCERDPPTTWPDNLLNLIGRDDTVRQDNHVVNVTHANVHFIHDVQSVCIMLDSYHQAIRTKEAARHSVSALIFSQDRRLLEAGNLLRYHSTQEAECVKQPDWSDAYHFEVQRRIIEHVTMRMWALPAGDGLLHYGSVSPMLTEKFVPNGFGARCLMHPMGITLNIDRSTMSEEKVGWAFFHAGVASGLLISKHVKGIDTSWVAFNKPPELTNRHAGLLLALGLGGHLRTLAKWLSFKYLTPKHTMTSVGLLLGLSASHIGTMDSLVTRMLSVHITRMLPPGAAELNVSPIAQTAGIMGIGLLYFGTQHRRMSEIMISEIEYLEVEDPDSGPDPLRDESYRLAAGFALGLINLGKGKDLRGLHGMHLPERLLSIAVGSRPVHAVHVFDRATAGAVIALALIYMKSGDEVIARKVNIPDTEAQFEHVRPDMLLLRSMAANIIAWDNISVEGPRRPGAYFPIQWIEDNLPACYKGLAGTLVKETYVRNKHPLRTADVPFYNIITGLAWALGLKYAGSGNVVARDEILSILLMFDSVGGESYYYDAKLARSTVRRCMDVLALAAATVMAGTGDLKTFRCLRRRHGRTDGETPYGSHMATHLAIGALFMGGGTHTFGTSDFAIASLICAFYPLFPADVGDNRVHLQAFRHMWVFAAEARCLIVDDIDTRWSIKMPVEVTMRDGTVKELIAPCLLPELNTIAGVATKDPAYWRVTLDFANNAEHLSAFKNNQTIYVRRCPPGEAHSSVFSCTSAALVVAQSAIAVGDLWRALFNIQALRGLDKADMELIMPRDPRSSIYMDGRSTVVDDKLVLRKTASSSDRDQLWNLRVLFAWAEKLRGEGGTAGWLRSEVIDALQAKVEERMREMGNAA